jgi:hypothetical protein
MGTYEGSPGPATKRAAIEARRALDVVLAQVGHVVVAKGAP